MRFNDFYELLESSTRAPKGRLAPFTVHFKPQLDDENDKPYHASNPNINQDVFSVYTGFLRQGSFKITYPNRDDACREKLSQTELEAVFEDREWENFIPYDPDCDILEWLEHPIWGVYAE